MIGYNEKFRLEIINLVLNQGYGIREVAQLHNISHTSVIRWIEAFRKNGEKGVKSPYSKPRKPRKVKPKMIKKRDFKIEYKEGLSPKEIKALQKRLTYLEAENAYLKELEKLDKLKKQRQKNDK